MIYLDSNATTQIDPRVVEAMLPFLREHYANPSASYGAARIVRKAIETAREQVAVLLECEPTEIIFTSGGTESNNAAIGSALTLYHPHKPHFVTVKTEHSAVLEPAQRWLRQDRAVSFLNVGRDGRANVEELRHCAHEGQTALVSMMWANNETGVIAPMEDAVNFAHAHGALFHTDAVQAVGKVRTSMRDLPVDYLSLSGHKFHSPKGIGALYVSKRVRFKPWILGGGQEFGRRSGTENVSHIVGMGLAAELMRGELKQGDNEEIKAMRDAFEKHIINVVPDAVINGSIEHRLHTTSSMSFPGVDAAGLLILLDERGVACAAGSACHTGALHPSHVLEAMGYDSEHARCTLRFSFSRFNTMEEARRAAELVIECVKKMRSLHSGNGPVREM